jgi:hypothetical protein
MTREMSRAQFAAALARNGFKRQAGLWAESRDLPGHHFGLLFDRKGKLLRRLSVAYLIKRRDEELSRSCIKPEGRQ